VVIPRIVLFFPYSDLFCLLLAFQFAADYTRAAMDSRRWIAQVLVILGNLALIALAVGHAKNGYPEISRIAAEANTTPRVAAGLVVIWLLVSWHWVAFGIIALAVSFGHRSPNRGVLSLCGLILLIDGVGTLAKLGWFIGDELAFLGAIAILAASVIFPAATNH